MDNDNRWWDNGRNYCPVPGFRDNASTCGEQDDDAGI